MRNLNLKKVYIIMCVNPLINIKLQIANCLVIGEHIQYDVSN